MSSHTNSDQYQTQTVTSGNSRGEHTTDGTATFSDSAKNSTQQAQTRYQTKFSTVPTVLAEYLEATKPADPSKPLTLEEKYELYKERMNRQHPIYRTSNGEYGQVPKGVKCELKPPEHTQSQAFSKNFTTGPYRYTGLNTSIPRSKFHSMYDGPL